MELLFELLLELELDELELLLELELLFDFSSFLYQQPESVAFNSVKIHYGYYSDSDIADFKSKIVPEYSAFRMKDEGNTGTYLYKKCFDIDFDPLSESIAKGNVLFEFNSDNKINLSSLVSEDNFSSNMSHIFRIRCYILPRSEIYIRGFDIEYSTKNIQDRAGDSA